MNEAKRTKSVSKVAGKRNGDSLAVIERWAAAMERHAELAARIEALERKVAAVAAELRTLRGGGR